LSKIKLIFASTITDYKSTGQLNGHFITGGFMSVRILSTIITLICAFTAGACLVEKAATTYLNQLEYRLTPPAPIAGDSVSLRIVLGSSGCGYYYTTDFNKTSSFCNTCAGTGPQMDFTLQVTYQQLRALCPACGPSLLSDFGPIINFGRLEAGHYTVTDSSGAQVFAFTVASEQTAVVKNDVVNSRGETILRLSDFGKNIRVNMPQSEIRSVGIYSLTGRLLGRVIGAELNSSAGSKPLLPRCGVRNGPVLVRISGTRTSETRIVNF
jgi:hypothetical protein